MKDRPLLVPITLEVLLLGKQGKEQKLADFTPHYQYLDENNLFGDCITNSGFASKTGEPGAHLHWTMPDALLDGKQGEDGSLIFPELPNRWLVVRFETVASRDRIKRKVWLVQSDAVTYTQGETSIPCLRYDEKQEIWEPAGKNKAYFAYLGKSDEYKASNEQPANRFERLTAVGAGDHLFSAFYPLCRNVFGFYDSIEEDAGTYTYQVFGYYDRESSDPFYGLDPAMLKEQFGWEWEETADEPDSILCHGAAFDVCWKGKDCSYVDHNDAHLDIVLANTSSEALACYLQNRMNGETGAERMLNALLCGVLEEFDNQNLSDSLLHLEDSLHEREFGYSGAGDSLQLQALHGNAEVSEEILSNEEKALVEKIQTLAETANLAHRRMESYGEEAYYCWHRYVECLTSPFSSEGAKEKKVLLKNALQAFKDEAGKETVARLDITKKIENVNETLEKKGFCMKSVPERSFVHPNPPVLLLAEEDTERVRRQGFQKDANGKLPCRMNPVKSLSVDLPEGNVVVEAKDVEELFEAEEIKLPATVNALCVEAVLLGTPFAHIIAKLALKQAKISEEERLDETIELVMAAQKASENRPFDISFREWKMPWNPIMMEWQVKLTPARTSTNDNTFEYFKLGEVDLEAATKELLGKEITVSGQTLLTPHAPLLLKKKLEKLMEDYGENTKEYKEMEKFAQKLEQNQILSQQLSGFGEALQGLRYVPALPVLPVQGDKELAACVQQVMNHIYPVTSPGMVQSNFLPIRGGMMRLNRLRLIDTFGQFRDVDISQEHLAVSEALRCDTENAALLPPRFPGGMRIKYQWLTAEASTSSPVCGFLMVNVFDRNLQVHTANGDFLGWLQQTDEGIKWRQAPGTSLNPEDITDAQLSSFVQGVLGWKEKSFESLLTQTDNYFSRKIGLADAQTTAFGMGNVLALVRAAFAVEEEGLHKKFWGSGSPGTNGYEKQEFPVRLGDERRSSDGLVGFFVEQENKASYDTLHLAAGEDNLLYLTLENAQRTVAMLLDPYGEVTLCTGFLPVLKERLSPKLYRTQAEHMKLYLNLWPVLTPAEEVVLPVAEIAGRKLEVTCLNKEQKLEVTCLNKEQKVVVQELTRSLPPILQAGRQEILEGYLAWKGGNEA
jgi:hypothetical protein